MTRQSPTKKNPNNPTISLEESLLSEGYDIILGIDEAGRGPWAGPLYFGGYIYDNKEKYSFNSLIKDSKLLSEENRELCFVKLKPENRVFTRISAKEVDSLGLSEAVKVAILELVLHVLAMPKCANKKIIALIDGKYRFNLPIDYKSIIDGDRIHYSISCGSIVAKVLRDHEMRKLDEKFPQYGFKNNKGYGTKMHIKGIEKYGLCEEHRKTYKPIREYIARCEQTGKRKFLRTNSNKFFK